VQGTIFNRIIYNSVVITAKSASFATNLADPFYSHCAFLLFAERLKYETCGIIYITLY